MKNAPELKKPSSYQVVAQGKETVKRWSFIDLYVKHPVKGKAAGRLVFMKCLN